jgi:hypothetical protein
VLIAIRDDLMTARNAFARPYGTWICRPAPLPSTKHDSGPAVATEARDAVMQWERRRRSTPKPRVAAKRRTLGLRLIRRLVTLKALHAMFNAFSVTVVCISPSQGALFAQLRATLGFDVQPLRGYRNLAFAYSCTVLGYCL